MVKKTKVYAILGIALIVNAVICIAAFAATYKEKKKLSAAFFVLATVIGSVGTSLMAIYASKENIRIKDLKAAIAKKDHWFHSFEYPECVEPTVKIEDYYFDPVETEDTDSLPF